MTIREALEEIAKRLQVEQKALINKGGELQAYKTGHLHNTLEVEVKPMQGTTDVVTDVPFYGTYVNFGTVKMRPRPFVEKSLDRVMKEMGNELLQEAGVFEINQMIDKQLKPVTIKN